MHKRLMRSAMCAWGSSGAWAVPLQYELKSICCTCVGSFPAHGSALCAQAGRHVSHPSNHMPQGWPYCSPTACRRTWRLGPCSPASRWCPRLALGLQTAPKWPSSSQGSSWGGCRSQGPPSRGCPRSSSSISCRRSPKQPLQTQVSYCCLLNLLQHAAHQPDTSLAAASLCG